MKTKELHRCWQCGEEAEVNSCGVCEHCWEEFGFLREGCKI